jgi:hypothetical protein
MQTTFKFLAECPPLELVRIKLNEMSLLAIVAAPAMLLCNAVCGWHTALDGGARPDRCAIDCRPASTSLTKRASVHRSATRTVT